MEEARGEAKRRLGRERAGEVKRIDAGGACNGHDRTKGLGRQGSVRKADDLGAFCIVVEKKRLGVLPGRC